MNAQNALMKIEFFTHEAQALINIINECVKSKGLDAAEAGIYFLNKIKAAHVQATQEQTATPVVNEVAHQIPTEAQPV